jgi:hypothetical protein
MNIKKTALAISASALMSGSVFAACSADIDMASNKITNLVMTDASGTSSEAANKNYVDSNSTSWHMTSTADNTGVIITYPDGSAIGVSTALFAVCSSEGTSTGASYVGVIRRNNAGACSVTDISLVGANRTPELECDGDTPTMHTKWTGTANCAITATQR